MECYNVELDMDADHAGDTVTAKSTSGWVTELHGAITYVLVDWNSRTKDATAASTADVEVIACKDGTTKSALPWASTTEKTLSLDLLA